MPPTLAKRYAFKLAANIASVPVYLVMEAILPRALGPRVYGNYSFATSLFQQFSGFLDMGTSTCFYNLLSRRQKETALFSFYLRFFGLTALLTALASALFLWPSAGDLLLPGMPLWIAPLAAIWAWLTWAGRVLRSANDALGATILSELWRSIIAIAAVIVLLILFLTGFLNIQTLFLQQYALLGFSAWAFWRVCRAHWHNENLAVKLHLPPEHLKKYIREFFNYSHPLFIQSLLSFGMLSAERWLLQWFDGGVQQGFFALSQKVSIACFLFVSAMTPLITREFSIAWGKNDPEGMGALLTRFAPLLYALAAYFSCFTFVEAGALVEIFGGTEFASALIPVQIMALYPMHQAYGQIAGSIFHASGKTRTLRNLTAGECVYGFAAAWFLLAPANFWGLNLGASGLAIKTVSTQFLSVNIYLWLASRFVPFAFWRNLVHQMICGLVFLGVAACASQIAVLFSAGLIKFLCAGIIYTCALIPICLCAPGLLGFSRQELKELARRFLPKKRL